MNSVKAPEMLRVSDEKHFFTFHFISSLDSGHLCLLSTTELSWDNAGEQMFNVSVYEFKLCL